MGSTEGTTSNINNNLYLYKHKTPDYFRGLPPGDSCPVIWFME